MADKKEFQFYINGKFYPSSEAKISVMDRSFLYGDAVMEGIPVWQGAPFKLDEHIDRLFDGMRILLIEPPATKQEVRKAILDTIKVNTLQQGWLRPQITRGEGQFADKWDSLTSKANFVILLGLYPPNWEQLTGQRAVISPITRVPSKCVPSATKDCNYLNNILASIEKVHAKADAAIMLDIDGNVVEGISYNIFLVKNGVLITPTTRNCLAGITRAAVMDLARQQGIPVVESDSIQVADLYLADEVFATASAKICQPFIEIDGRKIGNGKPGPVTLKLRELLLAEMTKNAKTFKWD
ncbi:MAG: aminotransferase class IV [Chloroflexi bacterium]|nr:aminotransferase class IV [Chloroflexota bacterium]